MKEEWLFVVGQFAHAAEVAFVGERVELFDVGETSNTRLQLRITINISECHC